MSAANNGADWLNPDELFRSTPMRDTQRNCAMNVKKTINIAAKPPLSPLAEAAGDVIIAKNGKPIANLIAPGNAGPTLPRIGFGLACATGAGPKFLEVFNSDDGEIAALFEGGA